MRRAVSEQSSGRGAVRHPETDRKGAEHLHVSAQNEPAPCPSERCSQGVPRAFAGQPQPAEQKGKDQLRRGTTGQSSRPVAHRLWRSRPAACSFPVQGGVCGGVRERTFLISYGLFDLRRKKFVHASSFLYHAPGNSHFSAPFCPTSETKALKRTHSTTETSIRIHQHGILAEPLPQSRLGLAAQVVHRHVEITDVVQIG